MKIVLFVEGQTEMALGSFFKRWLDARLPRRIGVKAVRFTYKKVIDGASLFQALPPETALEKCPYLKSLLNDMIQLAQGEA